MTKSFEKSVEKKMFEMILDKENGDRKENQKEKSWEPCPKCQGDGVHKREQCDACKGFGLIEKE
jgi:DnaJ-class molecular chaperone